MEDQGNSNCRQLVPYSNEQNTNTGNSKIKIKVHNAEKGGNRISGERAPREHKCSYCARVFTTGNGLGGHMKVHSKERRLKAQAESTQMQTEEPTMIRASNQLRISDGTNLLQNLSNWSITKLRGTISSRQNPEIEAANAILLLSGSVPSQSVSRQVDRLKESDMQMVPWKGDNVVAEARVDTIEEDNNHGVIDESDMQIVPWNGDNMMVEPRVENNATVVVNRGCSAHKCPRCCGSFSSGRALGAHKRWHCKPSENMKNDDNRRRSGKEHICKYCGKSFLTGNALGGHMKIHKKKNESVGSI